MPDDAEGLHEGRITLERLVQVCCENPARIYGLFPRKGHLETGADADIVLVAIGRRALQDHERLVPVDQFVKPARQRSNDR